MFLIKVAQLFQNDLQFPAHGSEPIIYLAHPPRIFGAVDESIIQLLAQSFVEHFGGTAGDVAFQLPGPGHIATNGGKHARRPFAADDVLQPAIGGAFR